MPSYSYDESQVAAKDQIRFLIGDTGVEGRQESDNLAPANISDEEIEAVHTRVGSNLYLACAEGCESIHGELSKLGQGVSAQGMTKDNALGEWADKAQRFRRQASSETTVSGDAIEHDWLGDGYVDDTELK